MTRLHGPQIGTPQTCPTCKGVELVPLPSSERIFIERGEARMAFAVSYYVMGHARHEAFDSEDEARACAHGAHDGPMELLGINEGRQWGRSR